MQRSSSGVVAPVELIEREHQTFLENNGFFMRPYLQAFLSDVDACDIEAVKKGLNQDWLNAIAKVRDEKYHALQSIVKMQVGHIVENMQLAAQLDLIKAAQESIQEHVEDSVGYRNALDKSFIQVRKGIAKEFLSKLYGVEHECRDILEVKQYFDAQASREADEKLPAHFPTLSSSALEFVGSISDWRVPLLLPRVQGEPRDKATMKRVEERWAEEGVWQCDHPFIKAITAALQRRHGDLVALTETEAGEAVNKMNEMMRDLNEPSSMTSSGDASPPTDHQQWGMYVNTYVEQLQWVLDDERCMRRGKVQEGVYNLVVNGKNEQLLHWVLQADWGQDKERAALDIRHFLVKGAPLNSWFVVNRNDETPLVLMLKHPDKTVQKAVQEQIQTHLADETSRHAAYTYLHRGRQRLLHGALLPIHEDGSDVVQKIQDRLIKYAEPERLFDIDASYQMPLWLALSHPAKELRDKAAEKAKEYLSNPKCREQVYSTPGVKKRPFLDIVLANADDASRTPEMRDMQRWLVQEAPAKRLLEMWGEEKEGRTPLSLALRSDDAELRNAAFDHAVGYLERQQMHEHQAERFRTVLKTMGFMQGNHRQEGAKQVLIDYHDTLEQRKQQSQQMVMRVFVLAYRKCFPERSDEVGKIMYFLSKALEEKNIFLLIDAYRAEYGTRDGKEKGRTQVRKGSFRSRITFGRLKPRSGLHDGLNELFDSFLSEFDAQEREKLKQELELFGQEVVKRASELQEAHKLLLEEAREYRAQNDTLQASLAHTQQELAHTQEDGRKLEQRLERTEQRAERTDRTLAILLQRFNLHADGDERPDDDASNDRPSFEASDEAPRSHSPR